MSGTTDPPDVGDPTLLDVKEGFDEARTAAAANQQIVDDFPRHMRRIATQAGEQAGKRQGRIFGVAGLLVAIVVSFLAGGLAVDNAAELAAFRTQQDQRQSQVDDTLAKLADQNEILAARGQAPVAAPPPSADPTEAIAALVLSRVIAQLPAPPATPTADEVAAAITPAVTANVLGPSQQQLTRMAADYYRSGGPAEAAIEAAVRRVIAENPPRDGRDGQSPQCLSEPGQCRGRDGADGEDGEPGRDGEDGMPGPTCEPGTHPEDVTLEFEEKTARICVLDTPPDGGP